MLADRLVFSKSQHPTSRAGNYSLIIPGDAQDNSSPGGDGYGTVKVDASGAILFNGSLADGSKVSQSSALSKQGIWPLYASLYGGQGAIISWLQFTNQTDSDLGSRSAHL